MDIGPYLYGWAAALLVGFSKTGLPGASILHVTVMMGAFPDDTGRAVGALLPVLLVGDVFAVCWYRHHAVWDRLWRLLPYVGLGMLPGWWLLHQLQGGDRLRPVVAVLILALLGLEICRRRFAWQRVPRRWWFVAAMGMLAGFSTITAHAALPVMAVYLLSQGMDKREFIGTAAWFFLLANLCKIPFYLAERMVTPATLRFDAAVAPAAIVGCLIGVWLLPRIPQRLFDALALAAAGLAAGLMLC